MFPIGISENSSGDIDNRLKMGLPRRTLAEPVMPNTKKIIKS